MKNCLSVEIGRKEDFTQDISDLGIGSIIELDKKANDMVDLFVNGKLAAKGKVIVIDGNFGIRIEEMISDV